MHNLVEILSGRAGLRGVQWMLCEAPMRRVLRHTLDELLDKSHELESCRLQRARFKPARKLTAYYDVTLRNGQDGERSIRPIEVTWSSNDLSRAENPAALPLDWLAMQQEAKSRGLATPFQQLVASAPAGGMRIQVSPLDVRFPQLVRVADPRYVSTMLASLCPLPRLSLSGAEGAKDAPCPYSVTPIRYRPGQRHVLRYDPVKLPGCTDRAEILFAKLYADDRGERLFQVTEQVAGQLATTASGVTPLRPRAYVAADALILYPFVDGVPLSQQLRRPGRRTAHYLWQAGAALRDLHNIPPTLAPDEHIQDFAAEVKATTRAGEHIPVLLPAIGTKIAAILDQSQTINTRLPQEAPTFTHSDFKADHLLITQDGLTLIDFDTCALADPALDIGKFLADLQWWYATYRQPGLAQAQECFLAGYNLEPHDPRLHRARLYEVLWLVKLTLRRVRLFDPAWERQTLQMIDLAETALDARSAGASVVPPLRSCP